MAAVPRRCRLPPPLPAEQRATRESIVLTKNEGNTLPLTDRSIKLAVIGPGASSLRLLYGGYTQPSMLEMFQVVQDSSAMAGVGRINSPPSQCASTTLRHRPRDSQIPPRSQNDF